MTKWTITAASIIGSGHINTDIPCQDASSAMLSENGEWVALVVSDGAGTAIHSDKSSSLVSASFAKALIELSYEIDRRAPGAWVNDFVIEHIIKTRQELRSLADSDSLQNYHCTLVACLIGSSGGFLIHIGDGAIFGGLTKNIDNKKLSLSHSPIISLPENGEYSNETYFITEGDWIKHLRITPISPVDWIVLGTDGGTTLAMIGDKEPKPGFIVPLLNTLSKDLDETSRTEKLKAILSDVQADKLTSDDKTLCIAYKTKLASSSLEFEMDANEAQSSLVGAVGTVVDIKASIAQKTSTVKLDSVRNSEQPIIHKKVKRQLLHIFLWVLVSIILIALFIMVYIYTEPIFLKYLDNINLSFVTLKV